MIFVLSFLFVIRISGNEVLDQLSNKKNKNIISAYPKYFFGVRLNYFGDCPFETSSLKYNTEVYTDCLILKNGKKFTIQIGENGLCTKDDKIIPCEDEFDLWNIKKGRFGYLFIRNKKCLTFKDRNLELKECLSLENQVFDFIEMPQVLNCIEEIEINNILNFITPEEREKLSILGENLKKVLNEKIPPSSFENFLDNKFPMEKDKEKKEEAKKLAKLFNSTNKKPGDWNFNWKFPSLDFLNFFCPI
ncbi:hypothetical protein TUBRATIS_11170 [Tubulinosema ratisbonensis]|uniref:Uncharacterized protein n=1 Tax=Tubulinosema ratisbonensis TaxID=291195 RepID=A0A437AMX5_9MICR|nr:hypothetical protein TUBRATIS_11170 [Tubulinosema ratisbonensis]